MKPFEIRLFKLSSGKVPFIDWHSKLDKKSKAVIDGRLQRVRCGNLGDCKHLGDGVFELRIDYGPGFRVYFGMQGQEIVILLIGGNKTTQNKDIQKAKDYWSEWE